MKAPYKIEKLGGEYSSGGNWVVRDAAGCIEYGPANDREDCESYADAEYGNADEAVFEARGFELALA